MEHKEGVKPGSKHSALLASERTLDFKPNKNLLVKTQISKPLQGGDKYKVKLSVLCPLCSPLYP